MGYYCSDCSAEFDREVAKCNTPDCKGVIFKEYVPKETQLKCHVCERVFQGNALINCNNENCPGVIFPTEIED